VRTPATAAVVLMLVAGSSATAGEPSPRERADAVLSAETFQTELPGDPARERKIRAPALNPRLERLLIALAYVAIAVAVAAFAFAFWRRASDAKRGGGPVARRLVAVAPAPDPASVAGPEPTLDDADRLAQGGAYREAVHTLLLVAIGETARQTSSALPPSATARELRGLIPLVGSRHDGFDTLVGAVERSLFGGCPVDAEGYAGCRARCLVVIGREAV
jgi:hypothetical protein